MKSGYIALALLILILAAIIYNYYKQSKPTYDLCFELPKSRNPQIFGPSYWNAFHTLASRVPCGMCRGFAEKFVVFFHDTVNFKLDKPLYDKENFDYFTALFADIHAGKNPFVSVEPSTH